MFTSRMPESIDARIRCLFHIRMRKDRSPVILVCLIDFGLVLKLSPDRLGF